jgi:Mg-chelatase subunit ChlD
VPSWIRRSFTAPGVTQIPPGQHLSALQDRYGGTVMLCIDVSNSMYGRPLAEAVAGALEFVSEAVAAHYKVGVLLWNVDVAGLTEPSADGVAARQLLSSATSYGGTSLLRPLRRCHEVLDGYAGDRVVAVFGDGDLGPREAVLAKVAEMKDDNIRFITRGLGPVAAREFGEISSEEGCSEVEVGSVDDLAAGIAGMAASLRPVGGPA